MSKRADEYSYTSAILANEINITTEGLRYYEKQGIGQYLRKENGYRAYQPQEAAVLRLIRNFNAFGFPLKESIDVVTKGIKSTDLLTSLKEKQILLEQKIRYNQIILYRLEQHLNAVSHFSDPTSQIWFEELPEFYHLNYTNGLFAYKNKELNELVHRWMDQMPISLPIPKLSFENFQNETDPAITGGFSIEKQHLDDLSLIDNPYCTLYPARTYLCSLSHQTTMNGLTIHEKNFQNALQLMHKMNLEVDGDCFFQSILASERSNRIEIDYKVYIPFAPKRKNCCDHSQQSSDKLL